ncbi:hypothetical protein [Xanthobacter aminoxidans]|uniref:hypothetical protein n=1 Tax=Xanthobacter aminoxidans TaxID=186280 RepID=UPI00202306E4|nr:hypothetical protein [Xanthobacter aminoxidans]MCL8385530.1 hypothetical protein [Xanthobacter aminoxidans]
MAAKATLPAPRLQFRWEASTDREYEWVAHYELVLPLGEHDCRRDREGCENGELALRIGSTMRGSRETCPNDLPYRDGAYSRWDNAALGGHLPVIVIDPLGQAFTAQVTPEGIRMAPFAIEPAPQEVA